MDSSRDTAEKIRPILQAMERSIADARRKRTHDNDLPIAVNPTPTIGADLPASVPTGPSTPTPAPGPRHAGTSQQQADADQAPPRLKARPKRATLTDFDSGEIRSRAS